MDSLFLNRPLRVAVAAWLAVAGLIAAASTGASAAACGGSGAPSPNVGSRHNLLTGVAATSACNAWAVGQYYNGAAWRTLIEQWNGKTWNVRGSPNASSVENGFYGVAAVSSTDAWAVGDRYSGTVPGTLIAHWDGTAWKLQRGPNPSGGDALYGVTAVSSTDAWAVGDTSSGTTPRTLVEHWNGRKWSLQRSPNPSTSGDALHGVTAVSPTDAWAVGNTSIGTTSQMLIEHWNGKRWKVQPSPNPRGSMDATLSAVAALSSTDAWAVGDYYNGTMYLTLIEHWNGKAWHVQPSPSPGTSPDVRDLVGVAAASSTNAWAVGHYINGGAVQTLIEHWNGRAWNVQPSPNPGASPYTNELAGVTAISSKDAWVVGDYFPNGTVDRTLVERWNGKAWKG